MRGLRYILICAAVVQGCYATGVKVNEDKLLALERGVTSWQEVVERLGEPTQRSLAADGSRQFVYTYTQSQLRVANFIPIYAAIAQGADAEQTSVVLDFDPAGKLVQYTATSGKVGMGTGFSSGARQ